MTSKAGEKLPRDFYRRPSLAVARDLVGKIINLQRNGVSLSGRIAETEAYIGEDDPACHARFGRTKRNCIMYGDAGYVYVYFIYGMYHMLNIITERKGRPAAVLIRAMEPLSGIEVMKKRRKVTEKLKLSNGPGKLCQALALTIADTGQDLLEDRFCLVDDGYSPEKIVSTTRIGIRAGTELPWRFFDADSRHVSVRRVSNPAL